MKRILLSILCVLPISVSATTVSIVPDGPIEQGGVFQVRITDIPKGVIVRSVDFDGNATPWYSVGASIRAVRGLPLTAKTGTRPLTVKLSNGQLVQATVHVIPKEKPTLAMPSIPAALGGNTVQSEVKLISTLAEENKKITNLFSQKKALWFVPFRPPVSTPVVTDVFGYSRQGSATTITHKGTDYRAPVGTPVYAMNRGVVRLKRLFRNYGNTIIIDHGLGVMTYYMHLSRTRVAEGQLVLPGQLIGFSGDTGYVSGAHLHLTVRINGASVDPEKFLQVMGE